MWLPSEQRKLLSYYYREINTSEEAKIFEITDLIQIFGGKKHKKHFESSRTKREIILDIYNKLENLNKLLMQRDLIKWENLDQTSIDTANFCDHPTSQDIFKNTKVRLRITLTIKGYDLGWKYSHWHKRLGLWIGEYHWVWLIISGIIGTLIGSLITLFLQTIF